MICNFTFQPQTPAQSPALKDLLWRMAAKDADVRSLTRAAKAYWAAHAMAEMDPGSYTLIPDPRRASRPRG